MTGKGLKRLGNTANLINLSFFLWGIGEGLWWYIQPLFPAELGANPGQVGLVIAMQGVGRIAVIVPIAWLMKRFHPRQLMIWGGYGVGALGVITLALAQTWQMTGVGYFIYGVSLAALIPISLYMVLAYQQDPTRDPKIELHTVLNTLWAANAAGIVISPSIGGIIGDQFGLRSVFGVSAIWFVFATLIALRAPLYENTTAQEPDMIGASLLRSKRFWAYSSLFGVVFLAGPLGFTLAPTFLEDVYRFSADRIGLLGMLSALGMAGWSLWLGHRAVWSGFIIAQLLQGMAFLLFMVGTFPITFASAYFMYGAWFATRPLATSLISHHADNHQQRSAFLMIELLQAGGAVVAPLMAGLLYQHNPRLPFIIAFAMVMASMGMGAFLATYRNPRQRIAYNGV